jgi:RNA polymerase-binding protein DksA
MTTITTIDSRKRAEFAAKLKQRYRELWADVQRELGESQPYQELAGETHDIEDEAAADLLVDLNLADIHRDILEMRDVEAALQRIVDRSYGRCCECGGNIPLERLSAYPTAKRCQPCQRRYEQTHVAASGPRL